MFSRVVVWLAGKSHVGGRDMPGTAVGLFLIDFIARPFARIFEKMPSVMFCLMLVLYGYIAYIVLKSAWQPEKHYPEH